MLPIFNAKCPIDKMMKADKAYKFVENKSKNKKYPKRVHGKKPQPEKVMTGFWDKCLVPPDWKGKKIERSRVTQIS